MSPDQLRLEEHLKLPQYTYGEILGYWGRVSETEEGPVWPFTLFWISVPPIGPRSVVRYYLRLELTDYNMQLPAGCFWDPATNARLAHELWPRVTGPFAQGFRTDWNQPNELYAPWDRGGQKAHPEWKNMNAAVSLHPGESTIADYLSIMYEILNSENYHGTNA